MLNKENDMYKANVNENIVYAGISILVGAAEFNCCFFLRKLTVLPSPKECISKNSLHHVCLYFLHQVGYNF